MAPGSASLLLGYRRLRHLRSRLPRGLLCHHGLLAARERLDGDQEEVGFLRPDAAVRPQPAYSSCRAASEEGQVNVDPAMFPGSYYSKIHEDECASLGYQTLVKLELGPTSARCVLAILGYRLALGPLSLFLVLDPLLLADVFSPSLPLVRSITLVLKTCFVLRVFRSQSLGRLVDLTISLASVDDEEILLCSSGVWVVD
mmetsp:Transcript_22075/g.72703  ORF Transcript_22075/g.72703 Transcript_22075/m.72703 type:complete len:200 (-) Transcript_22075:756-1355(-)